MWMTGAWWSWRFRTEGGSELRSGISAARAGSSLPFEFGATCWGGCDGLVGDVLAFRVILAEARWKVGQVFDLEGDAVRAGKVVGVLKRDSRVSKVGLLVDLIGLR